MTGIFAHNPPYRRLFWRLGLIWPLVLLLLALWLGVVAWEKTRDAALIARMGVQADVRIIRTERVQRFGPERSGVPVSRGRSGQIDRGYWVTFRFTPDGQAVVTKGEFVRRRVYDAARQGQARVTFAANNPQIATLDLRKRQSEAFVQWLFTALALAASGGLGWWLTKRYHALLPILFRGERREAVVTALYATGTRIGRHDLGELEWRDSSDLSGTSLPERLDRLVAYPKGTRINVFIDPKTGRAWWDAQM